MFDPIKNTYDIDNIIEWLFDKSFDQLTINSKEIYVLPFEMIISKTFKNSMIHDNIANLSKKSINIIQTYLTNDNFINKFLLTKIKKKLHVAIIVNDMIQVEYLISIGYNIDYNCLKLAVINNKIDVLKFLLDSFHKKIDPDLLAICGEFNREEIYFYLRSKNLFPNLSVYYKASIGNNLSIIKEISSQITANKKVIENIFKMNHTDIIKYILCEIEIQNLKFDENLIIYPIENNNQEILNVLENKFKISWHCELYYSALLSGNMDMIYFLENKLFHEHGDIHENHILDTSRTKKGRSSLLIEDIIYQVGDKKYFSHTLNYAIQSNSLEVVKYIYNKKYGLTTSNFITAIKQSTIEILDFLCDSFLHNPHSRIEEKNFYKKTLPQYILHYFGTNSYIKNKIAKAKILVDYGLLDLSYTKKFNVDFYKKESVHLQLIAEKIQLMENEIYDIDHVMNYQIFFVPIKGYKLNYRLITVVRLCLELKHHDILKEIFSMKLNVVDRQFAIDCLYLFGNIDQIKLFHPFIKILPSQQIIMEIMCRCEINKLCYLNNANLLLQEDIDKLYSLSVGIDDIIINAFFAKLTNKIPTIKNIITTKKISTINNWLLLNKDFDRSSLNKNLVKDFLCLDNIETLNLLDLQKIPNFDKWKTELVEWCIDQDLIETSKFITDI
ncbi:ankyrin repeat protein [Cotonvirus japonicus]|uniref:Ankyrin repeat protein n=1 Tax=Cotonvirus japonicus TaxID=2811091 RepID=A0ABM7NS25_9VIRU|nr:ankyrin repeat protein [Cotonvirus japonicus]BCS82963.1 ankyrin repeat protein [Cotonvirus japonicus]